jgi:hypothetical protein
MPTPIWKTPIFARVAEAIGFDARRVDHAEDLASAKAVLAGRAGDVWELVTENL